MYIFPHSVTSEDIYRTIYASETAAYVFRKAAYYRYMNDWSKKIIDMDDLTYQWPMDWRIPSIRKYDRDAYIEELPDSSCYELVSDSEKASGGYYINTFAHAKADTQLINAPADYILLGKSGQGQLFVNANYDSPYHGIVIFISNDYRYQAIVAHDAETFREFWIESIVTAIDGGNVVDVCKAMQRDGHAWTLFSIDGDVTFSKTIDHSERLNILEQLRIRDSNDICIVVNDVGCYYSVGIIDKNRVERAGALFNKATGLCIVQGLGYLPDYPILTWEKSFIQLMHIVRQEEQPHTQLPFLANLREYAFSHESIFAELDTYCGGFMSKNFRKYTTLKQKRERYPVAYCDGCRRGLCEMIGIWYTCEKCGDYDMCLTCYEYLHKINCKKCNVNTNYIKNHVINGKRCCL